MIPIYIPSRYDKANCSACSAFIAKDELCFYTNETKTKGTTWCKKCGLPEWKAPGSPYDIRIKSAIARKQGPKEKIKLALKRFQEECRIEISCLNMESSIMLYLIQNLLVIEAAHHPKMAATHYCITPRGNHWNVDLDKIDEEYERSLRK